MHTGALQGISSPLKKILFGIPAVQTHTHKPEVKWVVEVVLKYVIQQVFHHSRNTSQE